MEQVAVWGIAFTAEEMRKLTEQVIDNLAIAGTLIHRYSMYECMYSILYAFMII